jgi:UDP-N-acetylmuramate dehydrogenase
MTALSELTTLRIGGPAGGVIVADTRDRLIEAATKHRDGLVLAGGSNVVVSDSGFPGQVILVRTSGLEEMPAPSSDRVRVKVAAGVDWSHLVDVSLARGLSGLEFLTGIPGSVGATPIQNVGAYGSEVSDVFLESEVLDRSSGEVMNWTKSDWQFGYRTSRLKMDEQSHVVLSVTFELTRSKDSLPVTYPALATHLGVKVGDRVPLALARDGVLALRRSKGMLLDENDHDTWSVGSFFVNPVISQEAATDLPTLAPRWPTQAGAVKTSAAWLIEHCGFHGGYSFGAAAISTKHVLALTNRGGATCDEVMTLASLIRDSVKERTGVYLTPEPRLINCRLS